MMTRLGKPDVSNLLSCSVNNSFCLLAFISGGVRNSLLRLFLVSLFLYAYLFSEICMSKTLMYFEIG
jgi:hypothetical protein